VGEDGRITFAGPAAEAPAIAAAAEVIDASGATVMPGLIEAHWHASYLNVAVLEDLDIAHPPETVALHSAANARVALGCGCTATEGIRNALVAGFDTIEHGTFMDQECLELMLENDVPCVPALQFELASVEHGPAFDMPQDVIDGHQELWRPGREAVACSTTRVERWGWVAITGSPGTCTASTPRVVVLSRLRRFLGDGRAHVRYPKRCQVHGHRR
jgi:imidazolonepropionase-like amidohydrolase